MLNTLNIKKQYVCDNLAEQMGHTVLRLPPYHCVFNPIEHMWHQVKSKVRAENVSPTLGASVIKLTKTHKQYTGRKLEKFSKAYFKSRRFVYLYTK